MSDTRTRANRPTPLGRGRMLHVRPDGACYLGRGLSIYRSSDDGATWAFVTKMPCPAWRRAAAMFRPACRLLRHEVKAAIELSDGTIVAANRQGVYRAAPGEPMMTPAAVEAGGQGLAPPMTLTCEPNDRVLFGEYDSTSGHGKPVRLFVSDDRGRSFRIAHVFEGGSILHLHNVQYDAALRQYWVLAGDHHHEPGIGRLSEDLSAFEWVAKGEQRFRAVQVFDFGESLIYGTDTELERNAVVRFDKVSGRVERLQELDGSCIYGCRFGGLYALSTSIEPSKVNTSRTAGLWLSRDGEQWTRVFSADKDRWHPVFFQFGSIVLPRGESGRETVLFSGQALRGIDGLAFVMRTAQPL